MSTHKYPTIFHVDKSINFMLIINQIFSLNKNLLDKSTRAVGPLLCDKKKC